MEGHTGGSRSIPTVHPCSQSGRRLWVARKALHLHEPNHEGNGRSIHNMVAEHAHVPQPASPSSAQCESMECADVPDVSNEERNDDLSSTVPSKTPWQCKPESSTDKMVGDNKNTARCRWSVSVPAECQSVMVALGVSAGLTPSVGARRHQRSLF